jgi:hypothetical protein
MRRRLAADVEEMLTDRITDRVLAEAGVDDLVAEALDGLEPELDATAAGLVAEVADALVADRARPWTAAVKEVARRIVGGIV